MLLDAYEKVKIRGAALVPFSANKLAYSSANCYIKMFPIGLTMFSKKGLLPTIFMVLQQPLTTLLVEAFKNFLGSATAAAPARTAKWTGTPSRKIEQ